MGAGVCGGDPVRAAVPRAPVPDASEGSAGGVRQPPDERAVDVRALRYLFRPHCHLLPRRWSPRVHRLGSEVLFSFSFFPSVSLYW